MGWQFKSVGFGLYETVSHCLLCDFTLKLSFNVITTHFFLNMLNCSKSTINNHGQPNSTNFNSEQIFLVCSKLSPIYTLLFAFISSHNKFELSQSQFCRIYFVCKNIQYQY